jgi:hypothetical protein
MQLRALFAIVTLEAASLACSIFLGGPKLPETPVTVATEAVRSLQSSIEQAAADSLTDGTFRLEITESQLTAYLVSRLNAEPDPVITDPHVELRDGSLIVYGQAHAGVFVGNLSVTSEFSLDENGQPKVTIEAADLGPLPAPQALRDWISALLDETLTGSIGPAAIGFRLETIEIADGLMTVTGRLK